MPGDTNTQRYVLLFDSGHLGRAVPAWGLHIVDNKWKRILKGEAIETEQAISGRLLYLG